MTNKNDNYIIGDNPLLKHAKRHDEKDYLNIIYSKIPEFERKQEEKYKITFLNQMMHNITELEEIPILVGKSRIKELWNYLQLERLNDVCTLKIGSKSKNIKSKYFRELLSPYRNHHLWVVFRYFPKQDKISISFHKPSLYTFFIKKIGWIV